MNAYEVKAGMVCLQCKNCTCDPYLSASEVSFFVIYSDSNTQDHHYIYSHISLVSGLPCLIPGEATILRESCERSEQKKMFVYPHL